LLVIVVVCAEPLTMADIAVPRHSASPDTIAAERVDEGRWESEGGPAINKPLAKDPSAEAPLSEVAKSGTDASIAAASYDVHVHHPSVIEGAPGRADDSKYGQSSDTKEAAKVDQDENATLSDTGDSKPPQQRKKSFSERLAGTWHDIKAKADALVHRKSSRGEAGNKDATPSKDATAATPDAATNNNKE